MSIDVTETESDKLYNEGYDDGYEGRARKSDDPSYLEGYYDGQQESEDRDGWFDYEDGYDYED